MPVSERNSRIVYHALKQSGVKLISALPETWLVHLINMAEADPDTTLVRLAREEEGIGISAGAHLAGVRSALLMLPTFLGVAMLEARVAARDRTVAPAVAQTVGHAVRDVA